MSHSRPRSTQIKDMNPGSLSRWVAHPDCNAHDLKVALDKGFNPNVLWDDLDLEESDHSLYYTHYQRRGEIVWANVNTPLHRFSLAEKFDAASVLLDNGGQMELLNALGRTAMHEVVTRNLPKAVRFLIENGANVNAVSEARRFKDGRDIDRWGWADVVPLHEAVWNSNKMIAEILIRAGANRDHISPGGWTILDLAFLERDESVISLLLQHGAQTSQQRILEKTAKESLRESARTLLEHTAMFPSDECRKAYLHVVSQPEFTKACTDSPASRKPLDVFLDLLSRAAELPNPENVDGAPCCSRCVGYLEQLSAHSPDSYELHANRCSLTQSAKDGCCLCAVFEDAFGSNFVGDATASPLDACQDNESRPVLVGFRLPKYGSPNFVVSCGEEQKEVHLYPMSECFVMNQREYPDSLELGTRSPRAFETARAWLRNCQLNHPCCKDGKGEIPALPTRVIDVGNASSQPFLHQSNGECVPYLALSYCWGRSGNFRTTKESVLDHMRELPFDMLPATLRDAIVVTRELGCRYLWIDAICIVQDDVEDWSREAAKMQSIYANAVVTLSALASDSATGGLFRPRGPRLTSPVQLSLHLPPRHRPSWGQRPPKLYWFLLPDQASNKTLKPGPIHSRAWTLQEQHLSQRIIHFGSEMMYWECLSSHGSESDPEGQSSPYRNGQNNFKYVRQNKRIVQGHPYKRDLGIYGPDGDEEETKAAMRDRLPKALYRWWQELVLEYSSRKLTEPTDKVSAFLGLSRKVEDQLGDEFVAGIWKKTHFLPSLLWNTMKPGVASRNPHFPSWTWASIVGKVQYRHTSFEKINWEPSEMALDVQASGPSQKSVTGRITLKSTVRKFPSSFEFGCYSDTVGDGMFWRKLFGPRDNQKERIERNSKVMSDDELREHEEDKMLVESGFRDVPCLSKESKESAEDWEGAGNDIYCVVIGRISRGPLPKKQPRGQCAYPAFPKGRPPSLICLCLTRVENVEARSEPQGNVYHRIGLCEFWDRERFWKGAMKDEWVTIV